MKALTIILGICISLFILMGVGHADESTVAASGVDWKAFCTNLAADLDHPNKGVRLSAMQMVVQYGDHPEFKLCREAIFNIVGTFRNTKEPIEARLLAMSALYKTGDAWAMDFMRRHLKHETNPRIKQCCCSAVYTYYKKSETTPQAPDTLLASQSK